MLRGIQFSAAGLVAVGLVCFVAGLFVGPLLDDYCGCAQARIGRAIDAERQERARVSEKYRPSNDGDPILQAQRQAATDLVVDRAYRSAMQRLRQQADASAYHPLGGDQVLDQLRKSGGVRAEKSAVDTAAAMTQRAMEQREPEHTLRQSLDVISAGVEWATTNPLSPEPGKRSSGHKAETQLPNPD